MAELDWKKIRLLALDIGNTLVPQCPWRTKEILGVPGDPWDLGMEVVAGHFDGNFARFLLGNCTEEEFFREFSESLEAHYGRPFPVPICRAALDGYLGPVFKGLPEVLQRLHENGTRIVFFSDIQCFHWGVFRKLSKGQLDFITEAVRSDEEHALKPDPVLFQAFERKYGKPDLYLDNLPHLISAANASFGWPVLLATGDAALLRQQLGMDA